MDAQPISTLAEFLSWVEATRPKEGAGEYAMFYRGHSDAEYKMEPTVYRPDKKGLTFRRDEHCLYEEMFRHSPSSFSEDRNLFERVVRMQHHGLPTRLLDLTQSPLVALYFASSGHAAKPVDKPMQEPKKKECDECPHIGKKDEGKGKDGEVIFLPRRKAEVLHSSDIPEAALAGVEQAMDIPHIASQVTRILARHFRENTIWPLGHPELKLEFQQMMEKWGQYMDAIGGITDLFDITAVLLKAETEIRAFVKDWDEKVEQLGKQAVLEAAKLEGLEKQAALEAALRMSDTGAAILKYGRIFDDEISGLISNIADGLRLERNAEKRSLNKFLNQFTHYHFVFPPLNNERIRRQQGAFIIYPPGRTRGWTLENVQPEIHRARIRADAKISLLEELSHLGITQGFIYADLNSIAADVKMRYAGAVEEPIRGLPRESGRGDG